MMSLFKMYCIVFIGIALYVFGFFWFAGCFSSWSISSTDKFEKEHNKRLSTIQEQLQSLLDREKRQDKLMDEIEDFKNIIEKQQQKYASASKPKYIPNLPYIYGITPTYKRPTQKADLTRLCQTFKHVSNFHWIIVEDAESKRDLIERFLVRCGVQYTHLAVRTKPELRRGKHEKRWEKARGAEQRNVAVAWLRENVVRSTANGVVYFIDDDNTYDLEIFEQIRGTKKVSTWPVGLAGGLRWEGPLCENGKIIKFWATWDLTRPFPIDMAGFAINVKLFLDNPTAEIDVDAPRGHLESSLLKLLVSVDDLEPVACEKILVWHTRTAEPKMKQEIILRKIGKPPSPTMEV